MVIEKKSKIVVKLKAGQSIISVKPIFTNDSRFLIVASYCNLKVFSVASGDCFQNLKGHKCPIISIQENKRNQLQILSCSEDGIVIRWDYMSGTAVKTYNLMMQTSVSAFYAPLTEGSWFAITKPEDTDSYRLYSLKMVSNRVANKIVILKPVLPDPNSVSFGVGVKFIVGIYGNWLNVFDYITKKFKSHKTGERELTCVTCHPSEYLVATGDNTGRVLVWANMLTSNQPTRSIYHWHTLPVADLSFSTEGSHIYSGGGESALVKWNLNLEGKHILPRLGLPILFCAVANNSLVATAHADNAVQIISPQNQVVQVIQGLTIGHFQGVKGNNVAPTGLQYDPRTLSIVTNGRPGHLQFYKIHEDKQLFNLDIVSRNIMSQERNSVIINPDVDKAALDYRGTWLATVESRDDKETSPEIHLKFWSFELSTQKFSLNTSVFLPHYKKVNCLKFQPPSADPKEPYSSMVVSTSDDKHFKLWVLKDVKDGDKTVSSWSCESMGYYRDLCANDACFSEDGSILAVAFGHVATLWTPDTTMLKATLFQAKSQKDIQQLIFGRDRCSHLLVCHSSSLLTVWDVLTLTVKWTVKCNIQTIASDPNSSIMVAFTKEKNLFVFKPSSPKPLAFLTNVSKTEVISAIFIPRCHPIPEEEITPENSWLKDSEVYFLNKNQELRTVCEESDSDQNKRSNLNFKAVQNVPTTPFALLQAQQQKSAVKPMVEEITETDENNKGIFQNYGYQNPAMLCGLLIPSLLHQKTRNLADECPEVTSHDVRIGDSDSDDDWPSTIKSKTVTLIDVFSSEDLNMEVEECFSVGTEDYCFVRKFVNI